MKKLLVLLSCGHRVEHENMRLGASVRHFTEAKDNQNYIVCHVGGTHESFVTLVLTSTTDRVWIEEGA